MRINKSYIAFFISWSHYVFPLFGYLLNLGLLGQKKKRSKINSTHFYTKCLEELSAHLGGGLSWDKCLDRFSKATIPKNRVRAAMISFEFLRRQNAPEAPRSAWIVSAFEQDQLDDANVLERSLGFLIFMRSLASSGGNLLAALQCHLRMEQRYAILHRKLFSATLQLRYQALILKFLLLLGLISALAFSDSRRHFFFYEGFGQLAIVSVFVLVFAASQSVNFLLDRCDAQLLGGPRERLLEVTLLISLWEATILLLCMESAQIQLKEKLRLASVPFGTGKFSKLLVLGSFDRNICRSARQGAERLLSAVSGARHSGGSVEASLGLLQQDLWFALEEKCENEMAKVAPKMVLPVAALLLPALIIVCIAPLVWEIVGVLPH